MAAHTLSRRASLESQEKPYPSGDPSEAGDLEAQEDQEDDNLPRRVPTHVTFTEDGKEGAPLEISPSHLSQPPQLGIPNGGFTAWLQVACGFFMFFNSWGLINAFGVWQDYYSTTLILSLIHI